MSRKLLTAITALSIAAGSASAAEIGFGGPLAGFVADSHSHAIWPVRGLPAGQTLGTNLDLGLSGIDRISISDDGTYALLVSTAEPGTLKLARKLRGGTPELINLEGVEFAPDRVVMDRAGFAGLYDANTRSVTILEGLPQNPRRTARINIPGDLPLHSLAVDGAGRSLLIGLSDGQSGSVYQTSLSGDSDWQLVAAVGDPTGIQFAVGRQALVLDGARSELLLIADLQTGESRRLASAADGIDSAVALRFNVARKLAIAISATKALTFDLSSGGAPASLDLPVTATRGDWLEPDNLLVLNDPEQGPMYVLDLSGVPATYFVPSK